MINDKLKLNFRRFETLNYLITPLSSFFTYLHDTLIGSVVTNNNVSYGLAIILFTLIIKTILLPLNIKQVKSSIKMQEIQPEIKKIQEKYKNDPQKVNQEMMSLYKEKGANPFSGCLPLFIQMPILWALYYVFNSLTVIQGVSFLWIPDLYQKDIYYILPILSAGTTYLSTLMMSAGTSTDSAQAKQTGTMNIGMSIFMGFMSLNFKSALVLYWVVGNVFSIGQTILVKRLVKKQG